MPAPRKTVEQYEAEATRVGECLLHPRLHHVARHVYRLRHGEIPPGMLVCHTCDVTNCIEDSHHFLGTRQDNIRDSVAKGRHSSLRKGGVRFSGPHDDYTKKVISEASKKMWETRKCP